MLKRLKFWERREPQVCARQVFVNEPLPPSKLDKKGRPRQRYVTNKITTSKYSIFSFVPKNLYEQFHRVANFFFLLLVILQWFPEFATINPIVAALPMFIITGITAIKDGFEDFKRHVTDRSVNNRKTWTLGNWTNYNYPNSTSKFFSFQSKISEKLNEKEGPKWKETMFKDVRVGDFIKLNNDEFIPADILILSTSEPNSLCYVETKNLDGETNLKIRSSVPEIDIETPEDCASIRFFIDSQPPAPNLYSYNATLVFPDGLPDRPRSRGGPTKIPVNLNSLLLRGCVLKNTEWVIGLVVFTGSDTKLALNSGETPSKRSQIERLMNPQIFANLVIMALMCVWCAVGTRVWEGGFIDLDPPFLVTTDSLSYNAFMTFWNALILFQNIVPISLYLSMEFVKSVQAFFIFMDKEMHYGVTDTPCIPKNWNLSDDLGQIEYMFSDKTGTLTRNVMEFRKCSIGGKVYGEYTSNKGGGASEAENESVKKPFTDKELLIDMQSADQFKSGTIKDFFTLLAICHTVLVSTNSDGEQQYKAQSPDEAALVQAAKDVGYTFHSRESDGIFITTPEGEKVHYELLNVLEFTSARKRMSIIVRNPLNGRIILFCKGADNVIFERLKIGQDYIFNVTGEHLEEFAREGLRTLCLGYTEISQEQYNKWNFEFREASTALNDRDKRLATVYDKIETDLILLGATAIEDRLQDGVPECIATLKRAGIKIWVLTGDKMETAISIGFSTCLLNREMNLIIVRGGAYGEPGSAYEQMRNAVEKFFPSDLDILESAKAPPVVPNYNGSRPSMTHTREMSFGGLSLFSNLSNANRPGGYALIIDGSALKHTLEESFSRSLLLDLACRCKGVICCRVSPLQKAKVVELVKEGKQTVTCAIGDGANDVSMIQAAHIGIGVAGEEGLQAVMASDYAIAQFRFLTRLLLVHGHYAYIRNSSLILNFFYKNMIGVGVLFWFQLFDGYSTTIVFEYTYTLFWNLFFTCCAVLAIGVFDRDIPDRVAVEVPELYQWGMKKKGYTMPIFFIFLFEGFYQSLVCFFIPYFAYGLGSINYSGRQPDYLELGTEMAAACITVANLFNGFNAECWTVFHFISVFGSIGLFYIYVAIYSLVPDMQDSGIYGFNNMVYRSAVFWFCIILSIVISILPRFLWKYWQSNYLPTDADIVKEVCKEDLQYDFIHDSRFNPTLGLYRNMTHETVPSGQESSVPIYTDGIFTNTPRHSFTTERSSSVKSGLHIITHSLEQLSGSEVPETPASMTFMRTGITSPMRGYAFSQEEGTGRIMAPPLRRRKTNPGPLGHVSRLETSPIRRMSLPDVRASADLTGAVIGEERIRMVQFRESSSTSTSNIHSRRESESLDESDSIQPRLTSSSEPIVVMEVINEDVDDNIDQESININQEKETDNTDQEVTE
ncbi:1078_t:CDS:2 [Gigaspora margarita]|uniref:Phospholipid-transporting ATPase n=1 Tax=Gigaspora margarita TaxID=4874 RepID=A0ABM8W4B7_GIGMA|nr:1078_t:CDS:2 [Gigaspora margarita]